MTLQASGSSGCRRSARVLFGIEIKAALANLTWDQGLRRGNSQLLAVMACATRLMTALMDGYANIQPLCLTAILVLTEGDELRNGCCHLV